MNKLLNSFTFYIGTKAIHDAMETSLKIHYTKELINHSFDRNKTYLLYIHIPFCNEFCTFCNFHKFKYEEKETKEYFFNLRVELKKLKDRDVKFHSAYIGGGTPFIDSYELAKTVEFIKKEFNIEDISCETTPNHIHKDILQDFKGLLSRISIGVQSFNDDILKKISRYDKYGSSKSIQEKITDIKGIIPCISIDLIFNFPKQTKEILIEDLKIAKNLDVEQIVTYPLMSSKFKNATTLEHFVLLKESLEYDFYRTIQDELKDYHKKNAWAFSKDKKIMTDEYTIDNNEYIGVGSGAFTYINNQLFVNAYNLQQYKHMVNIHNNANIAMTNPFSMKHKVQYLFLLQLFGGRVDINTLDKSLGLSIEKVLKEEIFILKAIKAIKIKDKIIQPTQYGNYIALIMMKEFYAGMDNVRAKLKQQMNTQKDS